MDESISRCQGVLQIKTKQFKSNDLFWSIALGLYSEVLNPSDEYFPSSYSELIHNSKELTKIFQNERLELLEQFGFTPDDGPPNLQSDNLSEFENKFKVGVVIFSHLGKLIFCERLPKLKFDRVVPILHYIDKNNGEDRYALIRNLSRLIANQVRRLENENGGFNLSACFRSSDGEQFYGRYKGRLTFCLYCLEYTKFGANPHSSDMSWYLREHNNGDFHCPEECNLRIPPYLDRVIVLNKVGYDKIERYQCRGSRC